MSGFNFGFNPDYLAAGGSVAIKLRWGTAPFSWSIQSTSTREIIRNGNFATSDSWIFNNEWAHDAVNLEADIDGSQAVARHLERQIDGLVGGRYCTIALTVKNYVAGNLSITLGSTSVATGISADGDYTYSFVNTESSGATLQITADADFDGSVDDVSILLDNAPYWFDSVTTTARENTLNASSIFPEDTDDIACTIHVTDANSVEITKVLPRPYPAFGFASELVVDHSDDSGAVTGTPVLAAAADGDEIHFMYTRAESVASHLHQLWQTDRDGGDWRDTQAFAAAEIDDYQMINDPFATTSRLYNFLLIDSDHNPHLISFVDVTGTSGTINHRYYDDKNGWQTEDVVAGLGAAGANSGIHYMAVVMDSDDVIHIVYTPDAVNDLLRYVYGTAGSWTGPSTIDTASGAGGEGFNGGLALAIDSDNGLHLFLEEVNSTAADGFLAYYSKTEHGAWSAGTQILDRADYAFFDMSAICDSDGYVYLGLAMTDETDSSKSIYQVTNATGSWVATPSRRFAKGAATAIIYPQGTGAKGQNRVALDADGNFYVFFLYYRSGDAVDFVYYCSIFKGTLWETVEIDDVSAEFSAYAYAEQFAVCTVYDGEPVLVRCAGDENGDENQVRVHRRTRV